MLSVGVGLGGAEGAGLVGAKETSLLTWCSCAFALIQSQLEQNNEVFETLTDSENITGKSNRGRSIYRYRLSDFSVSAYNSKFWS
jgi:hypothetical protein